MQGPPIRPCPNRAVFLQSSVIARVFGLVNVARISHGRGRLLFLDLKGPDAGSTAPQRSTAVDRLGRELDQAKLAVFALPLGVGALEVFYAVFFEVP